MRVVSFKLNKELDGRIGRIAREKGVSRSAVIREAIEQFARRTAPRPGSALALAGKLVGSAKGLPRDLSTRKYEREFLG